MTRPDWTLLLEELSDEYVLAGFDRDTANQGALDEIRFRARITGRRFTAAFTVPGELVEDADGTPLGMTENVTSSIYVDADDTGQLSAAWVTPEPPR